MWFVSIVAILVNAGLAFCVIFKKQIGARIAPNKKEESSGDNPDDDWV